ncbi:hypothetical protein H0H81_004171 [Sphagnurus paluster]|uniref:Uncharacterized protein n=1 Tax=Sphagnurus paluster TaxID=117069 RepID=A0A9P7GLZ6_9AGAR|nr:hypothetical protein H0H81_004171 [Sphagnurus paluster]
MPAMSTAMSAQSTSATIAPTLAAATPTSEPAPPAEPVTPTISSATTAAIKPAGKPVATAAVEPIKFATPTYPRLNSMAVKSTSRPAPLDCTSNSIACKFEVHAASHAFNCMPRINTPTQSTQVPETVTAPATPSIATPTKLKLKNVDSTVPATAVKVPVLATSIAKPARPRMFRVQRPAPAAATPRVKITTTMPTPSTPATAAISISTDGATVELIGPETQGFPLRIPTMPAPHKTAPIAVSIPTALTAPTSPSFASLAPPAHQPLSTKSTIFGSSSCMPSRILMLTSQIPRLKNTSARPLDIDGSLSGQCWT